MALDHLRQRKGTVLATEGEGLTLPRERGLRRQRRTLPADVELGVPRARHQPEAHLAHMKFVLETLRDVGKPLREREAVHPEPKLGIDSLELGREAGPTLDTALRQSQQVLAAHVLERPARLQSLGRLRGETMQVIRLAHHLVPDDRRETGAPRRIHLRMLGDVLDRSSDVGERGTRRLDQALEDRRALGVRGNEQRDVGEQQHVTGELARRALDTLHAQNGRRLHAEQAARAVRGDETGALPHVPRGLSLHRLDRMQDHGPIEDAEHRSAEPEQLAAILPFGATEQRFGRCVVEQDSSVAVADEHALIELGDQRGEPIALCLDPCLRLGHRRLDIRQQFRALVGKLIDGVRDRLERGCRFLRQTVVGIRVRDELRALGDRRRTAGQRGHRTMNEKSKNARQRERKERD